MILYYSIDHMRYKERESFYFLVLRLRRAAVETFFAGQLFPFETQTMIDRRASGILAHITSLPSAYGIGDIGISSYNFIDFLVDLRPELLAISTYRSDPSTFRLLPLHEQFRLCRLLFIVITGTSFGSGSYLLNQVLHNHPDFSPYLTDYQQVEGYKKRLLQEAFSIFHPENFPDMQIFSRQISGLMITQFL